jgi:myosin heavy subunit
VRRCAAAAAGGGAGGCRHIKNKPIVNRDPREAQLAALHEQIARLKAERDAALRQAGLQEGDLAKLMVAEPPGRAEGGEEQEEIRRLGLENRRLQDRLDMAEGELSAAREQASRALAQMEAFKAERDGFRHRLEELTGTGQSADPGDGGLTLLQQQARACEEVQRQLEARSQEYQDLLDKYNRREVDLKNDQRIFSAKNKKLSALSKQNQALKMENQNIMRRISMSPAVGGGGGGLGTPGSARALQTHDCGEGSKDSPTQLGDVRRRLDHVVGDYKSRAETDGVEDPLPDDLIEVDSGDEEEELGPMQASNEQLAEEEERRWRQGLLQLDVEVRDLSSTIDSKEKLLEKLVQSQVEIEKMRQTYESRIAMATEAVRTAEDDANKALQAVEKVKSQDEAEKAQLQKEHALKLKELEVCAADRKQWPNKNGRRLVF